MGTRKTNAKRCIMRGCKKRIFAGHRAGKVKGIRSYLCMDHGVEDKKVRMSKVGCHTIGCSGNAGLSGYCGTHEDREAPVSRPYIGENPEWKKFDVRQVPCLYCETETAHDFACDTCRGTISTGKDV
jgi:hypothetical protein